LCAGLFIVRNGFSDATVLDLVEHIYAAGSDPGGWQRFADRVNREVPGVGFELGCFLATKGEGFIQHFAHAGYNPGPICS
jgi:hypothetical protein